VRRPGTWPLFRPIVRWQFDRLASVWEAIKREDYLAPYEAALARVNGAVTDVLDLGTGTGGGARVLHERFRDARVVGADVAPQMLAEARKHAPDLTFVEGDAARLPFDDASFDVVAQNNMIPFLDELRRVLRPRGWAVLAFSSGRETPIWVEPGVLRRELEGRGFTDFAEIAAGRGIAVLARRGKAH
jgi:ubiquinone/menaquinone biosynthesis C-methylase UbiE